MEISLDKSPVIAAIDVGTNSFHLIVASVDRKGILNVITREKEMVRLGSSGTDMKYLEEAAIERGIATLKAFSELARSEKAIIRAVATSAVREALNKNVFQDRALSEVGVEIEVVSGVEEGRLIYLGALHALPIYNKQTLVIDIGGGSTETIIGKEGNLIHVNSEKLGAIRLTKRFFENGKSSKEAVKLCREYIRGEWAPEIRKISEIGFQLVVGCSGTIQTLARMVLAMKGQQIPDVLNGITIQARDLLEVINTISKTTSVKERQSLPGIDEARADIILAGSLIFEYFIKELNIDKILISPYALREGIVFDTVQKIKELNEYKHLTHLRYQTVLNLCHKFQVDLKHSEHVRDISLKIFDAISIFHKLGSYEREILEAASLLHDVGYIISHDQHHKHSYYIITHSDMPGFTNDEAEIIGIIARYHRKSHPKKKHPEFTSLPFKKQEMVKVLAGILRLSEGIDRRRKQYVQDVNINLKGRTVAIELIPASEESYDIEIWGANRRVGLLEEALGINIIIE
jgi:exopolyphosphatase/guanosine-5'-triphosphate,3'-diphosphate pyrophosphatase